MHQRLPGALRSAALLLCCGLLAAPLAAQLVPQGDSCSDARSVDDNSVEGGAGFANATQIGIYSQRFAADGANRPLTAICVCWTRDGSQEDAELDYELRLYSDLDGEPGDLLWTGAVSVSEVPRFANEGVRRYRHPLLPAPILPANAAVHLAVAWSPFVDRGFFLCLDRSPETALQDAYTRADESPVWTRVEELDPRFRAFMLAPVAERPPAIPVPSGTPLGTWILASSLLLLASRYLWARRRRTSDAVE